MQKPLDHARLNLLANEFGTPLWIYDAALIRERIAALKSFDTIRFAQKACSNTHILRLMRAQGVAVDAVSHGEIERALHAGFSSRNGKSEIVFTADLITETTLMRVIEEEIPMNAGSIDMLHQLGAKARGHRVWLRINPGFGHGHSNKTNTGGEHSKHGIWHTDLPEALAAIAQHGLKLVGLHMHIGSGVDYHHLQQVCGAMVNLVKQAGQDIEAISAGGGLSIPYQDDDPVIDTAHYFGLWDAARREIAAHLGHPVKLEIEPGRYLVAESGLLLAEVRATKHAGSNHFVLVDAGFSDLVRPSMYGSFHAISIFPRNGDSLGSRSLQPSVIAGPLCESGDVFTLGEGGVVLPRNLPQAKVGDLLVLHDTGAYGAAMSSNYNSRPLIAEVLIDGAHTRLIRRRQSITDLLALEEV
ncbi:diaminopimelate decarboxylase [Uliginosibacterium gangwonense]|uniref:diaminopimelate decarboxylase n=1 Tax=Uliginosibacterium gangwonense TaxID=392736 RepID=UPI00036E0C0F|nr:diaminopimelate decarboxylase [Uliginosibacterium gangwonense]